MVAPPVRQADLGDCRRHRSLEALLAGLRALPSRPKDEGKVRRIVRRVGDDHEREALSEVALRADHGLPGDAWERKLPLNPEASLTVIDHEIAELIANGQPLELFGDNLFVDLDLSRKNLPLGARLRFGEAAILEVSPKPHNGCKKFLARFGEDALRFVALSEERHRNLRGIYLRVRTPGIVRADDRIAVLARA